MATEQDHLMTCEQRDVAPALRGACRVNAGEAGKPDGVPLRTISSSTIFGGEIAIAIEHHGEIYRLAITRQGKLILTK